MGILTRWVHHLAGGGLMLAGVVMHGQTSISLNRASTGAPGQDGTAVAPMSASTSVTNQPRTLASMASQLEPAVEVLTRVLNQYRKSGSRDGEANTLCALANSYNSLGQQQKAIEEFEQALAIYRSAGDKRKESNVLSLVGDVYRSWGFPDAAVRFYRDALQLEEEMNDEAGKALVLNNLGVTYISLSNKKKALDYLNRALVAYQDGGDRHAEGLTLINIGAAQIFLGDDPQKAISLFQQALTQLEPSNDISGEADAFEMLGIAWAALRKKETAEMSFWRALELYRALGDGHGETSVLHHLKKLDGSNNLAVR